MSRWRTASGPAASVCGSLPVGHTSLKGARALRHALGREGLTADIGARGQSARHQTGGLRLLGTRSSSCNCISTPHAPRDLLTRLRIPTRGAGRCSSRAARPHAARRSAVHAPGRIPRDPERRGLRSVTSGRGGGARVSGGATSWATARSCSAWGPGRSKSAGPAARQRGPAGAARPAARCCAARRLEESLRAHADRLGLDVAGSWSESIRGSSSEPTNAATCVVHTRPDEVFASR